MTFAPGDTVRVAAAYATTPEDAKYVGRQARVLRIWPDYIEARVGMFGTMLFKPDELEPFKDHEQHE